MYPSIRPCLQERAFNHAGPKLLVGPASACLMCTPTCAGNPARDPEHPSTPVTKSPKPKHHEPRETKSAKNLHQVPKQERASLCLLFKCPLSQNSVCSRSQWECPAFQQMRAIVRSIYLWPFSCEAESKISILLQPVPAGKAQAAWLLYS